MDITRRHENSVAVYSSCERYRYYLARQFSEGPALNFLMLNPSTATETDNDPTVARCEARAKLLGYGAVVITNLFAWRSTDPSVLRKIPDPVGNGNDKWIMYAEGVSEMIICAWGRHGSLNGRGERVLSGLPKGKVYCLRKSKDGTPWHPLYLPYHLVPQRMSA